jgi:rRNA maturation endonuclease Nob1
MYKEKKEENPLISLLPEREIKVVRKKRCPACRKFFKIQSKEDQLCERCNRSNTFLLLKKDPEIVLLGSFK